MLGVAFWIWMAAAILLGIIAWAAGAAAEPAAGAVAWALWPSFFGFVLLPRLEQAWAAAALLAIWTVSGVALVAVSGGAASPLAAAFAILPALALAMDRPWAAWSGAAAVLAYAAGAGLALATPAPAALGAFPEMLSVAALAFSAGLLTVGSPRKTGSSDVRAQAQQRIAETAHELRTPLTHILGFSELIERRIFGPIDERYVEYAGLIRRSGSQLLELVNDHLDISRIDAGRYELDLETFDVRAIINEVVEISADSASRKSIALAAWLPDAPLMVRADVRALRRMLVNTIGNAIKFTPEGGRVVAAARAEGEKLVLETIDNGPGIPAEERALLGSAYERGAGGSRAEGTGLGLSLVRALAELHGGTLSFHDAPGGGALVRIEAPVLVREA